MPTARWKLPQETACCASFLRDGRRRSRIYRYEPYVSLVDDPPAPEKEAAELEVIDGASSGALRPGWTGVQPGLLLLDDQEGLGLTRLKAPAKKV